MVFGLSSYMFIGHSLRGLRQTFSHNNVFAETSAAAQNEHDLGQVAPKHRHIMEKYFQKFSSDGKFLTREEFDHFLLGLNHEFNPDCIPKSTRDFVFKFGSDQKGKLDFNHFLHLFNLFGKPNGIYQMAFQFFDTNKDGVMTKAEFVTTLKTLLPHGTPFNEDSPFMRRYFGAEGTRALSFEEFSHFLNHLNREIEKQEFKACDPNNTGTLKRQNFFDIFAKHISLDRLSLALKNKMRDLGEKTKPTDRMSWSEYAAFNEVFEYANMNSIAQIFSQFSKKAPLTKDQFSKAILYQDVQFSPQQISTIFELFGDGKEIDLNSCKTFTGNYIKTKKQQSLAHTFLSDTLIASGPWKAVYFFTTFVHKFFLGGAAGAVGATFVYPIDFIKTRMQAQKSGSKLYKNGLDCLRQTVRTEGVLGLFNGLRPQLVGVAPEKAIKLAVNDTLRKLFGVRDNMDKTKFGYTSLPFEIASGMGAGACQVIFTNPLEIIKIKLQMQGVEVLKYGAKERTAVQFMRKLGFRGLYKGASACLLRDVPFSAVYFPVYAYGKRFFRGDDDEVTKVGLIISGAVAGVFAAYLVTPSDVIKTRMQLEPIKGREIPNSISAAASSIMKQEGFSAFWKGGVYRVFRSSPQFAITLFCYEIFQTSIKKPGPKDIKYGSLFLNHAKYENGQLGLLRNMYSKRLSKFSRMIGTN